MPTDSTKSKQDNGRTLKVWIANCLMGGDAVSEYGTEFVRDRVDFRVRGRTVSFVQVKRVAIGPIDDSLKGRLVESSVATIENVALKDVKNALKLVDELCWLLTFAGACKVMRYQYEHPAGSGIGGAHSVSGSAQFFRTPIDIRNGTAAREFVEKTFDQYMRLRRARRLAVVFDYLAHAERAGLPIEAKLMLGFVALENLKSSYARSAQIPFVKGAFRENYRSPTNIGSRYTFEALLKKMFAEVGMRPRLLRLVRLRNDLIHTGLSGRPFRTQWKYYCRLIDLIREYLLRIMKYSGYYAPYDFERRGTVAQL
jgi:hypothetical protein